MNRATQRAIEVRRLSPDDWEVRREVRLAALRESPDAFMSSYEAEAGLTEAQWRERIARCAILVGWLDGRPVGTAAGWAQPDGTPELFSMWVAPEARGTGVADALVRGVIEWARAEGHDRLTLWVMRGNAVASRFYARHGFVPVAGFEPPPDHPCHDEDFLELRLR
jgi:GNAT superfamily N-acetyltransferase